MLYICILFYCKYKKRQARHGIGKLFKCAQFGKVAIAQFYNVQVGLLSRSTIAYYSINSSSNSRS